MNKRKFYALGVAGALTLWTSNFALGEITDLTKNKAEKVLDNPPGPVKAEGKSAVQQEVPNTGLTKKKISEMKGTPLDMDGIGRKDSLRQFLGLNQYKLIFENYNKEIVKKDKKGNIIDDKNQYSQNEITFPLVFDGLKNTFPEKLDEFLAKNEEFKKDVKDSKTVIVITKNPEKRFVMAYYKEGKLTLATHISPGLRSKTKIKNVTNKETGEIITVVIEGGGGINTPTGIFRIGKNDWLKYKRSVSYKRAPMPYAIWITGGIFLHHGTNVDGTKRSHGCIRVPGFYQEALYSMVEDKTKIVIKYTNS